MMEMSLSRYEQETVITFNEAEPSATVYTYNGKLKRKLIALCTERPQDTKQTAEDGKGGLTFRIPKKWVKVNPGRILTEEQRKEMKERGRKLKLAQNPR